MHGSSFNDANFVWSRAKELLKCKNTIKTCLIRLKAVLYYSLSLNICECFICQIYQ